MKKSTRLLALLLCIVMAMTLLPMAAFAEETTYKLVDPKDSLHQKIITLSNDRYDVKVGSEISYQDKGYGYDTTYMFPKDNGGTAYSFTIERTQAGTGNQTDYNRWWRWAKEGDKVDQRKDSSAIGHDDSDTALPTGWSAQINWPDDPWIAGLHYTKTGPMTVPTDGSRVQKYILMKPLLSPQPRCYKWAGGNTIKAAKCYVTIDTTQPVGSYANLWSANGTDSDHFGNFNNLQGFKTGRVYYGDLGQNRMYIVKPVYVYYDLNGGNISGDTSGYKYPCWTTNTASTSQKHRVTGDIEPQKDGQIFTGWYCTELKKVIPVGSDLNNGMTSDMHLVAQWAPDIKDPDYFVRFNGNGATSGSMADQNFKIDMAQRLNPNQYVQQYTVTYNANGGESSETSAFSNSNMDGWSTAEGKQPVAYADNQEVINLAPARTDPKTIVNLYAQWTPGTVILPEATHEVADDDGEDVIGWLFMGWYNGDTYVGMAGQPYTVTGDVTLTAKWDEIKGSKFYVYHSATGKTESFDMKDYATVETYKIDVTDQDGETHESKQTYITGYKKSLNLTSSDVVTDGYLYGGTFANEAGATQKNGATPDVANFNGTKWKVTTKKVGWPIPIDTGKVDTAEPTTVAGSATALYPEIGETYYIHEVSKQHLNPMTVSVWANVDGGYDVTHIYLMTAVDRTLYNQTGFTVDGKDYIAANSTNKEIYDQVGITQSGNTTYKSYYDLSRADTTQNSKVACFEVTGLTPGTNVTVVPYWITLDGVKVTGPAQRIFQYKGPGATNSYRALKIVSDTWITSTATLAPAPANFAAPLKAAPRFMASQASPVVIQTPDIVTVFDAGKEYTVEAVNNSIKDLIQPAGQDGKLFSGWYADEAFAEVANLNAVEDGDSVYAKYVSDKYMQVKYSAVFTLLNKTISLTSAVDSKDYAETGYVISTKNGDDKVVVSKYATKFALQNANQLFGVEKTAPLMNVDYKLNGLSKNDKITITPYWVTADGTTVYGTARTLTYTGLTMKG